MRFIVALLAGLIALPALAVEPDERLADPALETRARAISENLRCLVCQNQSIDDSNASLARDLRLLVRERLTAGDDDQGVERYLVARYGDFVLLKPRFKPATLVLWLTPALAVLLGGLGAAIWWRRARAAAAVDPLPLSAGERERLAQLAAGREGWS